MFRGLGQPNASKGDFRGDAFDLQSNDLPPMTTLPAYHLNCAICSGERIAWTFLARSATSARVAARLDRPMWCNWKIKSFSATALSDALMYAFHMVLICSRSASLRIMFPPPGIALSCFTWSGESLSVLIQPGSVLIARRA